MLFAILYCLDSHKFAGSIYFDFVRLNISRNIALRSDPYTFSSLMPFANAKHIFIDSKLLFRKLNDVIMPFSQFHVSHHIILAI